MVDIVTQGDAVTIEFEIDKAENGVITRPRDVSFTRYVLSCLIMSYICVMAMFSLSAMELLPPQNSSQLS